MKEIFESGLSGWIIFILSLVIGGGSFAANRIKKQQTKQSNIKAGGDVAGGDIVKHNIEHPLENTDSNKEKKKTTQKNITADGDVAGGDIHK